MTRKTLATLPSWEQTTCWVFGVSSIAYGIYRVHLESIRQRSTLTNTEDGWELFGGIKDVGDFEWTMVSSHLLWRWLPFLVLQCLTSRLMAVLALTPTVRKAVYTALGAMGTVYMVSWRLLVMYTATTLAFFLLSSLRSVMAILIMAFVASWICNTQHLLVEYLLDITTDEDYFTSLYIWASFFMRCAFFSLERVWALCTYTATSTSSSSSSLLSSSSSAKQFVSRASEIVPNASVKSTEAVNGEKSSWTRAPLCRQRKSALTSTTYESGCSSLSSSNNHNVKMTNHNPYGWPVLSQVPSFMDCLAYVFYVPLLFCGPLLTFPSFKQQIENPSSVSALEGINIALKFCKLGLLLLFNNVMLHCVFFAAFGREPSTLANADGWIVVTTGYLLGQFLANKYMFFFGLMAEVAKVDGVKMPDTPSCISYIYTYADMWRSFDRGLHVCLKRYINTPLKCGLVSFGAARTHMAHLITFLSLGWWHGGRRCHLMWSLLNSLVLGLESLGYALEASQPIKRHLSGLSEVGLRRLKAVLVYPVFILGSTSNMFLMAGSHFAFSYFSAICFSWRCFVTYGLVIYCMTQNAKHLQSLGLSKCPITNSTDPFMTPLPHSPLSDWNNTSGIKQTKKPKKHPQKLSKKLN